MYLGQLVAVWWGQLDPTVCKGLGGLSTEMYQHGACGLVTQKLLRLNQQQSGIGSQAGLCTRHPSCRNFRECLFRG